MKSLICGECEEHIALLSNVGPQNIKVTCWEFGHNLNLPTQFFEHPIVIF
jgi:hypothetical protein